MRSYYTKALLFILIVGSVIILTLELIRFACVVLAG